MKLSRSLMGHQEFEKAKNGDILVFLVTFKLEYEIAFDRETFECWLFRPCLQAR